MSVQVVAVRWSCFACEATVIGDPDRGLPAGWYEMPPPVWRAHHDPSHWCPDHADQARDLQRRREARFVGRTYAVDVEEYERVKGVIRQASHLLEQLKFSGQRAADRGNV